MPVSMTSLKPLEKSGLGLVHHAVANSRSQFTPMRILFVDDDPCLLDGVRRALGRQFSLDTALGPEAGLRQLSSHGPYAVLVADMLMPGMSGVDFLERARRLAPDTVPIMLTGDLQLQTATAAVNNGHVFRFLTKPCPPESLAIALEAALGQHRLVLAEREILERTLNGTAKALSDILSILDPASFGLGQKLREYMLAYARHLKIAQTWELELAAMLCQVGYITIPPPVLAKFRAKLSLKTEEKDMLARVPLTGSELLATIPRLEGVARVVLYHNKNFDGAGFPKDGIKGEDIPIGARVLRVLTDLLLLEGRGHTRSQALALMQTGSGLYDPQVLKSISACFDVFFQANECEKCGTAEITFHDLQAGHMLAESIRTKDGTTVVEANMLVTPMLLEKLRNFAAIHSLNEPIRIEHRIRSEAA